MSSSSKRSREESSNPGFVKKFLFFLLIPLSLYGLADAVNLIGVQHYFFPVSPEMAQNSGQPFSNPFGHPGGFKVITSNWSTFLGIPVAVYGAAFYLFVFSWTVTWFDRKLPHIERLLLPITGLFFLAELFFVYQMFFVIGATCPYCLFSAITATLIAGVSLAIYLLSEAPALGQLSWNRVFGWDSLFLPAMIFLSVATVALGWWYSIQVANFMDVLDKGLFVGTKVAGG